MDEFQTMGAYDNYFGTNAAENRSSDNKAIDHSTKIPTRVTEKSNSAVSRRENIDLLNADDNNKENDEKERKKVFFQLELKAIFLRIIKLF